MDDSYLPTVGNYFENWTTTLHELVHNLVRGVQSILPSNTLSTVLAVTSVPTFNKKLLWTINIYKKKIKQFYKIRLKCKGSSNANHIEFFVGLYLYKRPNLLLYSCKYAYAH